MTSPLQKVIQKEDLARRIRLGKEALMQHRISEAFDYLFQVAGLDADALFLFLRITERPQRLYLLTEDQVETVSDEAEEGNMMAKFVLGRIHYALRPEPDSDTIAKALLEEAGNYGFADAKATLALMQRRGDFGAIDLEDYWESLYQANNKGSAIAAYHIFMEMIEGTDHSIPEPEKVIETLKHWMNGNESDDLLEANPTYYEVLAKAYKKLGDKKTAAAYYQKAIDMGLYEVIADAILLDAYNENNEIADHDDYRKKVDAGCKKGDPYCFVMRTFDNEDAYYALREDQVKAKEALHHQIYDDLNTALGLGEAASAYNLGYYYYYGDCGFEKNSTLAWMQFIEGASMGDRRSWAMLSQMLLEGYETNVGNQFQEYCQLMAVRLGDEEQLGNVVRAYRKGLLSQYKEEIEKYYLPWYDSLPIGEKVKNYDLRLIGVVKADGSADILEYDVEEDFEGLAPLIGAEQLKVLKTGQLSNIRKTLGYKDRIVAWVDEDHAEGDYILTLEGEDGNPYSFDNYEDLRKILEDELGASRVNTYLDDYDGDGQYDPYV